MKPFGQYGGIGMLWFVLFGILVRNFSEIGDE